MARYDAVVVLAMLESTYGIDPVPTALANSILFQEVDWGMTGEEVERPMVLPDMGNDPFSVVAEGCTLSGVVDLAGSGTPGTAPAWAPLMRACGMAATVTASTRVDYTPVSTGHESAVFYHFLDGSLHKGKGARGDFSLELMAKALPKLRFNLTALHTAPAAGTLPSPTLTAFQEPAPVEPTTTGLLAIGANNLPFSSFRYTHGNRVVRQEIPGRSRILIEERKPSMEFTVEAPDAVSPDLFALIGTVQVISVQHGQVAGNIIEVVTRARIKPGPRYSRGPEGQAYLTFQASPEATIGVGIDLTLKVR